MDSKRLLRSSFFCVLPALPALSGCMHYHSDYVPPKDGRLRPVWVGDSVDLPSRPMSTRCRGEIRAALDGPLGDDGWIDQPGSGGTSGSIHIDRLPIWRVRSASIPRAPIRHLALPHVHVSTGHSGSSGSGSFFNGLGNLGGGHGGGGKELAVVIVVVVMVVMPIIAVTLATTDPESGDGAAVTLDEINAYNDLARTEGSACVPGASP